MSDIDGAKSESSSSSDLGSSSSSDSSDDEIEQSRQQMIGELRQIEKESKMKEQNRMDIDQKEQLIMNPEDINMKADH